MRKYLASLVICLLSLPALGSDGFVEYCQKKNKTTAEKVTLSTIAAEVGTEKCEEIAEHLEFVNSIYLDNDKLTDLKALSFFPMMTHVHIETKSKINLAQIEGLKELEKLYVDAPIQQFPIISQALVHLTLFNAKAISIADIAKNKGIAYLRIANTKLSHLPSLAELPNLEEIELYDGEFTKISDLPVLPKLKLLTLDRSKLVDIKGIGGFKSLTWLSLESGSISDISPIAKLTLLEGINIGANPVKDLGPLAQLQKLKFLGIENLGLKDLNFLADYPDLQRLDVSENLLTDVAPVAKFKNLDYLNLTNNNLENIDPVAKLTNLQWLFAGRNYIEAPIKIPDSMFQLVLAHNKIANLDWMAQQDLPDLEWLDVSNNGISDLSPIKPLEMLLFLNFANNRVYEFPKLAGFYNLHYVIGRDNNLTSVANLAGANLLTKLDLRRNRISDVSAIKDLENIQKLMLSRNYLGYSLPKTNENCPTNGQSEAVAKWCSTPWIPVPDIDELDVDFNWTLSKETVRKAVSSREKGERSYSNYSSTFQ